MSDRTADPGAAPGPASARPTILLADDEVALRHLATTVLERHGYAVLGAEDGPRALEVFRTARGRVGLVVLDQFMPGPGLEATLAGLRALDPAVRVLLMSGYGEQQLAPEIRQNLCGFLGKPFRAGDLLEAVEAGLAQGSSQ